MKNQVILIGLLLLLLSGCKNAEKCAAVSEDKHSVTSKSPVPKKVYVPEYYRYYKGKYTFVKGHYRSVVGKRAQHRRTLRGYTTHADYTSIR
jgi:hypothetical protein